MRTKKIVIVDEVMPRSFNCSHSSSTRLRTALDESKLASLKIPHEVVKAGLSKELSCYHYELISFFIYYILMVCPHIVIKGVLCEL